METPGVAIDDIELTMLHVYVSALCLIGVVALIVWARRLFVGGEGKRFLAGDWPIRPIDFAILLFMLVSGLLMASELVTRFWETASIQRDTVAGILTQGVLVGVFVLFRFYVASGVRTPLSPVETTSGDDFQRGLFFFLASLPLIWCVSLLWLGLATVLEKYGLEPPLTEQTMVRHFLEAESPLILTTLVVLAVVVAPISEELIFRAGVYRFLKSYFPAYVAMLVSSVVFSALHFNLLTFPSLIALGMLLCVAYEISGSIRVPMFLHAFFNLNSVLMLLLQAHGLE